jgi:NAD(P)-dependent dehydrogenase (short-subunit alcohol dehydrogenase family)
VTNDGPNRLRLDDKVALVTGIGPGMGRSIALALAAEGADLALAARRKERIDAVADEVRALGRDALVVPTDIADPAQCDALVDAALDRFGRIDVFVQNGHHQGDWTEAIDADLQSWREIMDINFWGALKLVQRVAPVMVEHGGGRIILVNSGAIVSNPPRLGAYAASKAALASLVRTLSNELAPDGVLVNGVTLGPVRGENYMGSMPGDSEAEREAAAAERGRALPLGHLPTPDECAGAVLFFASELSASTTGQHLAVNGGQWVT